MSFTQLNVQFVFRLSLKYTGNTQRIFV